MVFRVIWEFFFVFLRMNLIFRDFFRPVVPFVKSPIFFAHHIQNKKFYYLVCFSLTSTHRYNVDCLKT